MRILFSKIHFIDRFKLIFKNYYEILIPIFIGVLIRFPRIPHSRGLDGYHLVFESTHFLAGQAGDWLISPFSLFGLYAFSGYPFASIVFFSIFRLISLDNVDFAILLFTLTIVIISSITNTIFLKEVNFNKNDILLGNSIFLLFPTFLDYSYFNPSPRSIFIGFAPIALTFLIRFYKNHSVKDIFYSVIMIMLLMLFHRMGMVYIVLLIIVIIVLFTEKMSQFVLGLCPDQFSSYKQENLKIISSLILLILSFFFGFFVVPPDFVNELPKSIRYIFQGDFICYYIGQLINLILDYFIFFGPAFLLFPLGLLLFFSHGLRNKKEVDLKFKSYFLIILYICPLIILIKIPHYPRHFLIPFILPFIIDAWNLILSNKREKLTLLGFSILITLYYYLVNNFWRPIFPYDMIINIFTIGIILAYFFSKRYNFLSLDQIKFNKSVLTYSASLVLFIILFINSLVLMDVISVLDIDDSYPYMYTSKEEIQIANILKNHVASDMNSKPVMFFSSHVTVEYRIAAYSGCLFLSDLHGVSLMLSGYFDAKEVRRNSHLLPLPAWIQNNHIFNHSQASFAVDTWWWLLNCEFNSPFVEKWIKILNLKYFIKIKNGNYYFSYYDQEYLPSIFMETLEGEVLAETAHLILYQLLP